MWQIVYTTTWATDPADGSNVPSAWLAYSGLFVDITGTPVQNLTPDPNLVVIGGLVTLATLNQMKTDGIPILSEEELT